MVKLSCSLALRCVFLDFQIEQAQWRSIQKLVVVFTSALGSLYMILPINTHTLTHTHTHTHSLLTHTFHPYQQVVGVKSGVGTIRPPRLDQALKTSSFVDPLNEIDRSMQMNQQPSNWSLLLDRAFTSRGRGRELDGDFMHPDQRRLDEVFVGQLAETFQQGIRRIECPLTAITKEGDSLCGGLQPADRNTFWRRC